MHFSATNYTENTKTSNSFEIRSGTSGHYYLKIRGRLAPDWIVNLTSGISRNQINILRGNAKKIENFWDAEFELKKTASSNDPRELDYLALAHEAISSSSATALTVDKYVLDDDPDHHNGALYLEIRATDQLGFLGNLLNHMAFYSLFPEVISIETIKGMIFDRFWIRGMGGGMPSSMAISALKRKLDGFLKK